MEGRVEISGEVRESESSIPWRLVFFFSVHEEDEEISWSKKYVVKQYLMYKKLSVLPRFLFVVAVF